MAQLFNEQRHAAGIAVYARYQERVGLRHPTSHGELGFRSLKRVQHQVRRAGNPLSAVVARPAGQDDARAAGQLQQRLQ